MVPRGILDGRWILVVEDEAAIALDLQQALRDHGAIVIGPVAMVSEALAAIGKSTIDCALLDIKLGDDDVSAIAVTLEKLGVPMIFVTGYSDAKLPQGFEAHPIVLKPYAYRELLELITAVIGRATSSDSEGFASRCR